MEVVPVIIMDQSRIHTKKSETSLNARAMNMLPGGRQPFLRSGWFMKDGYRVTQEMIFSTGPYSGQQKGLRAVVEERIGEDNAKGDDHYDDGIEGGYFQTWIMTTWWDSWRLNQIFWRQSRL